MTGAKNGFISETPGAVGAALPGATVYLEDCLSPSCKTRYSLASVYKGDMLVNMDSQIPNAVVEEALLQGKVPELLEIESWKREQRYKESRFDFGLIKPQGFMEVKGVTLEEDGIARFPDAPTDRGEKHVRELIEIARKGEKAILFFLIQMKGPKVFTVNKAMDQKFSQAVIEANHAGVKILAYDSLVTRNEISIGKALPVDLSL